MSRILEKAKFNLKKKAFEVLKPQIMVTAKFSIDGKVVREIFCESLTFNWMMYLYGRFNDNSLSFAESTVASGSFGRNKTHQIDGSYYSVPSTMYQQDAVLGEDNKGIVVGTGVTAVAPLDYLMESQILEGSGSGQFNHQVQVGVQGPEVSGLVSSFILQRVFVNNSGGTINVTELGMFEEYTATEIFLGLHDIFTLIPVLDTKALVIEIKFSITT